jgi:hypothetical protein
MRCKSLIISQVVWEKRPFRNEVSVEMIQRAMRRISMVPRTMSVVEYIEEI